MRLDRLRLRVSSQRCTLTARCRSRTHRAARIRCDWAAKATGSLQLTTRLRQSAARAGGWEARRPRLVGHCEERQVPAPRRARPNADSQQGCSAVVRTPARGAKLQELGPSWPKRSRRSSSVRCAYTSLKWSSVAVHSQDRSGCSQNDSAASKYAGGARFANLKLVCTSA